MSRVLVVGGGGYIGVVLCEQLLELGYDVRVLDRLYFGSAGLWSIQDRAEIVVGDMRAVDPAVLNDVDAVINLGGLSSDPTAEYNPEATYKINTLATRDMAIACKAQGIQRYVFASSCSVYDKGVLDDDANLLQTEESELAPTATYAKSKYDAERYLIELADDDFCPVMLRKGTVYGFSPRMRYDLVVNTFVKDSFATGALNLHLGGEMWRPLLEIRDAARAYIACIEAPAAEVRGEIFNVVNQNFRISEVGLRVREALRPFNVDVDLKPTYGMSGIRNYRVSGDKIGRVLGFQPSISIEDSVTDIVTRMRRHGYTDFANPRYYNIQWMTLLEEATGLIKTAGGSMFDDPSAGSNGPSAASTGS
jgi:nucleoside-diphosphate-sugar epimerase